MMIDTYSEKDVQLSYEVLKATEQIFKGSMLHAESYKESRSLMKSQLANLLSLLFGVKELIEENKAFIDSYPIEFMDFIGNLDHTDISQDWLIKHAILGSVFLPDEDALEPLYIEHEVGENLTFSYHLTIDGKFFVIRRNYYASSVGVSSEDHTSYPLRMCHLRPGVAIPTNFKLDVKSARVLAATLLKDSITYNVESDEIGISNEYQQVITQPCDVLYN